MSFSLKQRWTNKYSFFPSSKSLTLFSPDRQIKSHKPLAHKLQMKSTQNHTLQNYKHQIWYRCVFIDRFFDSIIHLYVEYDNMVSQVHSKLRTLKTTKAKHVFSILFNEDYYF